MWDVLSEYDKSHLLFVDTNTAYITVNDDYARSNCDLVLYKPLHD